MRILVADNHKILADGLYSLLEQQPGMKVVGRAEDGRTAVRLACELRPDIVVMDIVMPELNGIEATRQIRAQVPGCRVVALSMHSDKRYVTGILAAGASGYVVKDSAFDELARAVRLVAEGKVYLSPDIAGLVMDDYLQRLSGSPGPSAGVLTAREREVLQLLAEGRSTQEIGRRLHLSAKTVETHRRNIRVKLGIRNLADLTKYAIREGIISLE
ncbi:MAG: response regulator [Myxococcales bacterium]|jgi:two-component system response regulator NreC